jgi:adenylate cyclase class 2
MGHLNVEIKARCHNHASIRQILSAQNAVYKGTDHQVDTYFVVPNGRLKLREGNIENYLIHYQRSNQEGPKESHVTLFQSPADPALKEVLTKALTTLAIVDKQREIYFVDNVKFHLDTVHNLGTFVEIEAIDIDGTLGKEKLQEQCSHYLKLFAIKENDLIAESYSDMVLKEIK